MRQLLIVLVLALGFVVPVAAFGEGSPPPSAVSYCQAVAAKIGNDAFVARFGPSEPWGHCYASFTAATVTTTTTTTTATTDDPATAACKAEYLSLGSTAFLAKYGSVEAFGKCVAAHKQQTPATKPADDGAANSVAAALCQAQRKNGKDAVAACVKASLAKARALVAACKTTAGSNRDAYRACLLTGVGTTQRR